MSRVLIVCWLLFNASYAFADIETKQTGGTGKKVPASADRTTSGRIKYRN